MALKSRPFVLSRSFTHCSTFLMLTVSSSWWREQRRVLPFHFDPLMFQSNHVQPHSLAEWWALCNYYQSHYKANLSLFWFPVINSSRSISSEISQCAISKWTRTPHEWSVCLSISLPAGSLSFLTVCLSVHTWYLASLYSGTAVSYSKTIVSNPWLCVWWVACVVRSIHPGSDRGQRFRFFLSWKDWLPLGCFTQE